MKEGVALMKRMMTLPMRGDVGDGWASGIILETLIGSGRCNQCGFL